VQVFRWPGVTSATLRLMRLWHTIQRQSNNGAIFPTATLGGIHEPQLNLKYNHETLTPSVGFPSQQPAAIRPFEIGQNPQYPQLEIALISTKAQSKLAYQLTSPELLHNLIRNLNVQSLPHDVSYVSS
jgi:hypothetical protein